LNITHWSSQDLARESVGSGIVPSISASTIKRLLRKVDLQPHRTRYWKTSRLDKAFKQRAEKILWCYANANRLYKQGILVVCVDEKPNCQVLERIPIRRAIPGAIEKQEFEYKRHGTVNLLFFLIVATGRMELAIPAVKDATHYIHELRAFRERHRRIKKVFLIQDNDPSHTAAATAQYFHETAHWWRPRYTPAHASWLNQAEILINTFQVHYLRRGSWSSCEQFLKHVLASRAEYNARYASPIEWTWTNAKMRAWFEKHATDRRKGRNNK
jgi:hypothetical protein